MRLYLTVALKLTFALRYRSVDFSSEMIQEQSQQQRVASSSSSSAARAQQTTTTPHGDEVTAGSGASGVSSAVCKPSLTVVGPSLLSTPKTLGNIEEGGCTGGGELLLVDWQTSFKSRSLEDILLESSTTTTSPPRSLQGHVTSCWVPAEPQGGGGDSTRLTGHAPLAANHGSLSSGHASLHGSLEMIQVSWDL